MKLPCDAPSRPSPTKGTDKWKTLTYNLEVVTPVMGGGAVAGHAEEAFAVRPTAIRGHLRFWWRILYANGRTGDELRKAEAEIWGGMCRSGDGKKRMLASKVKILVKGQPRQGDLSKDNRQHVENKNGKKKVVVDETFGFKPTNSEAYAFFPAQESDNIMLVSPGMRFSLVVRFHTQYGTEFQEQVLGAIHAWIHYGGVGARTRRGMGALHCESLSVLALPKIPDGLVLRAKTPCDNPGTAWKNALETYRQFRQARTKKYGRTHWPEPASLRSIVKSGRVVDGKFPRAALGLPIIFHFPQERLPDQELLPSNHENSTRMASPVITKPMFINKKWYSAFIFLRTCADQSLTVKLKGQQQQIANSGIVVRDGVPANLGTKERADALKALVEYVGKCNFGSIGGTP